MYVWKFNFMLFTIVNMFEYVKRIKFPNKWLFLLHMFVLYTKEVSLARINNNVPNVPVYNSLCI